MAALTVSAACAAPKFLAHQAAWVVSAEGPSRVCMLAPAKKLSLVATETYPSVYCGRGDGRSAKGKRRKGSFGNSRPKPERNVNRLGLGPTPLPANRPPRRNELEDNEYIHIDIDEAFLR
eukprot:jgi/Mesen1/7759/ME000408S06866